MIVSPAVPRLLRVNDLSAPEPPSTRGLEPGTYTVVGLLPNRATRDRKQVEQHFLLIDRPAGS